MLAKLYAGINIRATVATLCCTADQTA